MTLLDRYDGFLIDIDGVTWVGGRAVDGAAEAIAALDAAGKPYAFVTNSPRESPAEKAEALRAGGIEVDPASILTSAGVTIRRAIERIGVGGPALVIGTPSFHRQASEGGLTDVGAEAHAEARAIVLSGHDRFDYSEMRAAAFAARAGAPIFATGRDPTMPMPDGLWPGTGAVLASIETASGAVAEICGKPEPALFRAALEVIGAPGRVAMIGDRLDTDVAGAQRAGLDGILVTSDPTVVAELPTSGTQPDHVIDSLSGLLA